MGSKKNCKGMRASTPDERNGTNANTGSNRKSQSVFARSKRAKAAYHRERAMARRPIEVPAGQPFTYNEFYDRDYPHPPMRMSLNAIEPIEEEIGGEPLDEENIHSSESGDEEELVDDDHLNLNADLGEGPMQGFPCSGSGCDKRCLTKGALISHEKACGFLKPKCDSCQNTFPTHAALYGHRSSGACMKCTSTKNPSRKHKKVDKLRRLSTQLAMETPPPSTTHGCGVTWVEIEPLKEPPVPPLRPNCKRQRAPTAVTDLDLASEADSYTQYVSGTLKGRGATLEPSQRTITKHVNLYLSTMKFLMSYLRSRSSNMVFVNLGKVEVFQHLTKNYTFAAKGNGNKPPSAKVKKELLGKLARIYDYRLAIKGLAMPEDVMEMKVGLEAKLAIEIRKEDMQAELRRQLVGCEDLYGMDAIEEHASFVERQVVRWDLQMKLEIELSAEKLFITNQLKFMFLCVVSDAMLPTRKETWQYLRHEQPNKPTTGEIPSAERYFLCFRHKRGCYALAQLQNKTSRNLALEVPPELTHVVAMFLTFSGKGPVFPRDANAKRDSNAKLSLAEKQFRNLEVTGWKEEGLDATVQSQRHAVANHITRLTGPQMKEAYAKGMNTSMAYMYGTASPVEKRAYATHYTQCAQSFPAVQHHRHMVFKKRFACLFIMPVKTYRGAPATYELCKILCSVASRVTAVVLIMSKDRRHGDYYNLPCEKDARVVHVPIEVATKTPLTGTNAPRYDPHLGYLVHSGAFKVGDEEVLPTTTITNAPANEMECAQGQFVIHEGRLAEVRSPITAAGVPVLLYDPVPNETSSSIYSTWSLSHSDWVTIVPRVGLQVVLDWDVTSMGHVTVRAGVS